MSGVAHVEFGRRLQTLRADRSVSQLELASELGVSKVTIWKWEQGRAFPRLKARHKLASYFGCSMIDLTSAPADVTVRSLANDEDAVAGDEASFRTVIERHKQQIAEQTGIAADDVSITISITG